MNCISGKSQTSTGGSNIRNSVISMKGKIIQLTFEADNIIQKRSLYSDISSYHHVHLFDLVMGVYPFYCLQSLFPNHYAMYIFKVSLNTSLEVSDIMVFYLL